MNERIRKLRKHLDLTQQEFADRLSVKRGAIANYEIGRNEPTDSVVSLICREFNVNEEWIRNGTGEMFMEMDDEDYIMEWTGRVLGNRSNSFKKNVVKMLMSLTDEEWKLFERKAKELFDSENEQ